LVVQLTDNRSQIINYLQYTIKSTTEIVWKEVG